jgi:hypothetical protein
MKTSKAMKIIHRIAAAEGVSVFEVRLEMARAITLAYENENAELKDFWDNWKGRKPTPEEFIVKANAKVFDEINLKNLMK